MMNLLEPPSVTAVLGDKVDNATLSSVIVLSPPVSVTVPAVRRVSFTSAPPCTKVTSTPQDERSSVPMVCCELNRTLALVVGANFAVAAAEYG